MIILWLFGGMLGGCVAGTLAGLLVIFVKEHLL